MLDKYQSELDYYLSLKTGFYKRLGQTPQQNISIIYQINNMINRYNPNGEMNTNSKEMFERLEREFTAKS